MRHLTLAIVSEFLTHLPYTLTVAGLHRSFFTQSVNVVLYVARGLRMVFKGDKDDWSF